MPTSVEEFKTLFDEALAAETNLSLFKTEVEVCLGQAYIEQAKLRKDQRKNFYAWKWDNLLRIIHATKPNKLCELISGDYTERSIYMIVARFRKQGLMVNLSLTEAGMEAIKGPALARPSELSCTEDAPL